MAMIKEKRKFNYVMLIILIIMIAEFLFIKLY
jgi:hypothetical protein